MKRKKLALIVWLFFIGNSQTVFADTFNDVCSNSIGGANIGMSKEEVQSTWQHAGFEKSEHKQKSTNCLNTQNQYSRYFFKLKTVNLM